MASDIINGTLTRNDEATQRFLGTISKSTAVAAGSTASPPAGGAEGTAPAAPATPAPASSSGAAQTYPMEDPAPGEEPK